MSGAARNYNNFNNCSPHDGGLFAVPYPLFGFLASQHQPATTMSNETQLDGGEWCFEI